MSEAQITAANYPSSTTPERLDSSRLITRPVRNFREFYTCCYIAHDQYCRYGLMVPQPSNLRVFVRELLSTAATFVAEIDGKIVGTVTHVIHSRAGLPSSAQCQDEIDRLLRMGRIVAEGTKLASVGAEHGVPKLNGQPSLVARELIRWVFDWSQLYRVDDWVALVNPRHLRWWVEDMTFRLVREERSCSHVNQQPGVFLRLDVGLVTRRMWQVSNYGTDFYFGERQSHQWLGPYRLAEYEVGFLLIENPRLYFDASPGERDALMVDYPWAVSSFQRLFGSERDAGFGASPQIPLARGFADYLGIDSVEKTSEVRPVPVSLRGLLKRIAFVVELVFRRRHLNFELVVADEIPDSLVLDPNLFTALILKLLKGAEQRESSAAPTRLEIEQGENGRSELELKLSFKGVDHTVFDAACDAVGLLGGEVRVIGRTSDQSAVIDLSVPAFRCENNISNVVVHSGRARAAGRKFSDLSVLIAEDDPVSRRVLCRHLEHTGARVTAVSNGNEALNELARRPYSLVFLDCQMPERDGFDTARAIRSSLSSEIHSLPIVALTAYALDGYRQRCVASGMNECLVKPVSAKGIEDVLLRFGGSAQQDLVGEDVIDLKVVNSSLA